MLVVDVWKVRVLVGERRMLVRVAMWLGPIPFKIVRVSVVRIMPVAVVMR
jgi:hypothetical protein